MTFRIEENDRTLLAKRYARLKEKHPYARIIEHGIDIHIGRYAEINLDIREFEIVGSGAMALEHRAGVVFPGSRVLERGINAQGQHFVRGLR